MLTYEKCKELKAHGFNQDIHLCYQISQEDYDIKKNKGTLLYPFHEQQLLIPTWTRKKNISGTFWEPAKKAAETFACPSFEEIWDRLPKNIFREGQPYTLTITGNELFYHTFIDGREYKTYGNQSIVNGDYHKSSVTTAAADLWLLLKKASII